MHEKPATSSEQVTEILEPVKIRPAIRDSGAPDWILPIADSSREVSSVGKQAQRRFTVWVGVTALVAGIAGGGAGYVLGRSGLAEASAAVRPLSAKPLSRATISELGSLTADACSSERDLLPDAVTLRTNGKAQITANTPKVIVVSENLGLHIRSNVTVDEVYFCAQGPDMTSDGTIGMLGVRSYGAGVTLNGKTDTVYADNKVPPDGSRGGNKFQVNGQVTNFALVAHGTNYFDDVHVSGLLGCAQQDSKSHVLLWDYDTPDNGVIESRAEFRIS